MKVVEVAAGTVLLRRNTHRMSLTDTGHRLLDDARAMLTLAEESEHRLRKEQTAIEGNIRIFSTIDFGQSVVSRMIASFIQMHPAEGVTSLREATGMALGVAVLPEWLIAEDHVSGRLVRVLPRWQARELPAHVVYPAQRGLPARVKAFIDFAVDYMSTVLEPGKR
jgi:DNA-binding transcriptional LysR family regulator